MTQKQKELLLKDLCGRLPYDVKVKIPSMESPLTILSINTNGVTLVKGDTGYPFEVDWEDCKPYLHPITSMTAEQKREYVRIASGNIATAQLVGMTIQDWFSKNHIDYRGLIPMGLGIDATGKNIY